jgi:hypothetical protein
MTLLQDDSVYFPNTPNKPGLDQLSSADRKARITSKTNWFAEPLEASHDGRRADIRSGGLWVELFRALHASRRQAAVRELSKYRHLVQDAQPLDVSSPGSVPEPSAPHSKGSWTSGLGLALLLLACFVVIHAIAIVRIESATPLHSLSSSAPPLDLGD